MGIVRTAPAGSSLGTFISPRYTRFPGPGLINFLINITEPWRFESGAFIIGYVGPPQSAGTNFFAGPWRLLGIIKGDPAIPAVPTVFDDPWPAPDPGQKSWGRAVLVRADGRAANALVRPFLPLP